MNPVTQRLVPVPFVPSKTLYVPPTMVEPTKLQIHGRCLGFADTARGKFAPLQGEPTIRRIVDLGAGVGAFAAYSAIRWPYAWIDCFERETGMWPALRLNAPLGTRILTEEELFDVPCDLLHVGDQALLRESDGRSKTATGVLVDVLVERAKIVLVETEGGDDFVIWGKRMLKSGRLLVGAGVMGSEWAWQAWTFLRSPEVPS